MLKQVSLWLWHNTAGYRTCMALNCMAGILRMLTGLVFIYASKTLIDMATGNHEGSMLMVGALMVGVIGCGIGLDSWSTWLERNMEVRLQNRLRHDLFNRLLQAEWSGIERHHSGDLLNRIEQDVKDMVTMLTASIPSTVAVGVQFVASFIFLFILDSTLSWILVGVMPLFLLASKIYFKRMRKLTHTIRSSDSKIQSVIQESLQSRMVIKTLERGETLSEYVGELQSTLQQQVGHRTRFSVFSQSMVMAGFGTGHLVAFFWGVFQLSHGRITFGVMAAFLQLVGHIQRPAVSLSRLIPSFITGFTAGERLMELEKLPSEEQGSLRVDKPLGIKMEQIDFTYDNMDKSVFRKFSFDFPPGSSIAILGETGVGKTSLIRMMLALIKPQQGDLYLYDNEGSRYPISALTRSNFVYVPQGNTLFSGTIRYNLLLGNPDASEADLKTVLEIAAAEFVFSLPLGLDTLCGEKGGGVSEGQAQRIAIARALLRPGGILLLDEATSALDSQTEELILHRLKAVTTHKTIFFVTHRPTIAAMCDTILNIGAV